MCLSLSFFTVNILSCMLAVGFSPVSILTAKICLAISWSIHLFSYSSTPSLLCEPLDALVRWGTLSSHRGLLWPLQGLIQAVFYSLWAHCQEFVISKSWIDLCFLSRSTWACVGFYDKLVWLCSLLRMFWQGMIMINLGCYACQRTTEVASINETCL